MALANYLPCEYTKQIRCIGRKSGEMERERERDIERDEKKHTAKQNKRFHNPNSNQIQKKTIL